MNDSRNESLAFVQLLDENLNINFKDPFTGIIFYFDTLGRPIQSERIETSIDQFIIEKSKLDKTSFIKIIHNNPLKAAQTIKTPPF